MNIKKEDISKLDYSTIVGLLNEINRPSGGIKVIQEVCVQTRIDTQSKVLEIGSNTGFTSINIALLTKANVIGIDVNSESIENAKKYANNTNADVKFLNASGTQIPFHDNHFDLVWSSNVSSFITDKQKAFSEYFRVLKFGGYLIVIPIYYLKKPPQNILNQVSGAVGTKINIWSKDDWINIVLSHSEKKHDGDLELIYESDYIYNDRKDFIKEYIDIVMGEVKGFDKETLESFKKRYAYFINLFNKNLKYCGFSVMIFQKRLLRDQIELFRSTKVSL